MILTTPVLIALMAGVGLDRIGDGDPRLITRIDARAGARVSPDGSRLAYSQPSKDRDALFGQRDKVVINDLKPNKQTQLAAENERFGSFCWSPNGKSLFFGGYHDLKPESDLYAYDLDSEKLRTVLPEFKTGRTFSLTVSEDSKIVACLVYQDDKPAKFRSFTAADGIGCKVSGISDGITSIVFLKARHLLLGNWGIIRIHDLVTDKPVEQPVRYSLWDSRLAVSPNREIFFSLATRDVILIRSISEKKNYPISFPERQINCATFFSNDAIILGTQTGKVVVWDYLKDKEIFSFQAHSQPIIRLDFSVASKRLLTETFDDNVTPAALKLWDLSNEPLIQK